MQIAIQASIALSVIGAMVIGILLYYHKQSASVWVTFATILFIALSFSLYWQDSIWKNEPAQPSKNTGTSTPKTLIDLFKNDFNNLLRFFEDITLENKDGKVTIKSQAYFDFSAQTFFIGYYIPNTPKTYNICVYISKNYKNALDHKKHLIAESSSSGLQPVNTSELKFSGRVFLYHETPLLEEQRRALFALYKSEGLSLQFRDYQYVAEINKVSP